MPYIITILLLCILLICTGFTVGFILSGRNKKTDKSLFSPEVSSLSGEKREKLRSCLLCGRDMSKGEKMVSRQLEREDDSIIYMYGCSECANGGLVRTCPVCGRKLDPKGYLIGRMWLRDKTGKNHLHIAGCNSCGKIKI